MLWWKKIIDLPPSPYTKQGFERKEMMVNTLSIVTLVAAALLLIGCIIFGFRQGTILLIGFITFFFFMYNWFRRKRNYYFIINSGLVAVSIVIMVSCFYSGLLTSPVMFWLIALPMYSFWLLDVRHGFIWLIVALLLEALILTFGLIGYTPKAPFNFYTKENAGLLYFLNTTLILLIAIFAYDYEAGKTKTIRKIEEEKFSVEEALEKLEHTTNELIKSEKHKDLFLAQMSHEIRTPLNAIIGMSDVWKMKLDGEAKKDIRIVNHSAKNLLGIIDDILDITRIQSGRFSFNNAVIHTNEFIEGIVVPHQKKAIEKKLRFIFNPSKKLPARFSTDPVRLAQVINNLLTNGIKFTEEGFVKFTFGLNKSRKKSSLIFTVEDSGIGISEIESRNIFQPFAQANVDVYKKFGGTGLGLSICKQLVDYAGGTIKLTSKKNKGTRVAVIFPVKIEKGFAALSVTPSVPDDLADVIAGCRILLVDDEEINRRVTTKSLQSIFPGIQLEEASSGEEALQKIQQADYTHVLMDLQMPGMDGLETTRQIKNLRMEKGSRPKIIGLSAYAMQEDHDRSAAAGMDDYISKPFDKMELAMKIYRLAKG